MNPEALQVLIVDDSLTVRMDLEEAFRPAGFNTTLCSTIGEAREALSRGVYALVVLDVLLPDGDGLSLLQEIKTTARSRDIPVLLLSSEAEVEDRIRGLKTGADEYVGKPYNKAYVLARSRELLRARRPDRPAPPGTHVLLIDDSETFRQQLREALEARGFAVAVAPSGEEGLRMAADARPRAVIVDGVMPGIDGATVIRRVRGDAALRTVPCLLLTASEDRGGELRALDAGADSYARKEQDLDVILAKLTAMLRAAGEQPSSDALPSLLGPKRILTVDDSPTYLNALAAHLRGEGYEPILSRSGQEAIDLLAVQIVDCILLDLVMPGLSGHEVCRRIKGTPVWRDIPLIILTAKDDQGAMIDGINAGADDYITKSDDFETLKARLRAQLRRKQYEDENRNIRRELLRKEVEAAEARAARELAETRARLLEEVEAKNRELESFSYSVSHDLRAPLRAIDGFSKILLVEHSQALDTEGKRLLGVVRESVKTMGDLIDDLLEFSRVGRAEMTRSSVVMNALVDSVAREMIGTDSSRVIDFHRADLPEAAGDRAMLRQVVANLLGNAVKYTGPRNPARIEIGARAEGDEIVYFVKDNGVGFEMQYVQKLFGVFQRLHSSREFEGTGVGLALVKRIVERHGGRVWAEGRVGEGSTFFFTLRKDGGSNA